MKRGGMKNLAALILAFSAAMALCIAAETLTNSSIVDLHKLGLGDAVLLEKIKTSTCKFDTGTDDLKKLKEAGISDAVIAAMVGAGAAKPAAEAGSAHEAGIYVGEGSGAEQKQIKIEPQQILGTKSGFAFFAGFGETTKVKAVLDGMHAAMQLKERRPVFYFYFEKAHSGLGSAGTEATSPEDFVLSTMEIKKDKNQRRVVIGKAGLYSGVKTGKDSKTSDPFSVEKLGDGAFKVTPNTDLADGEYGFCRPGASTGAVFCFGIQSGEPAPNKK